MRIGLVSNPYKDPGYQVLYQVADVITKLGATPVYHIAEDATGEDDPALDACFVDCDVLISMGGDGTFLNAVHGNSQESIPILGMNLGSLGFMAEVQRDEIRPALNRIIQGDFRVEERMMLDVRSTNRLGEETFCGFALNEVLLSRGGNARIVPIELTLDGKYIELISCDGLMVSTPTGSTGYAMAAGGPIVHPSMSLMQITPVCPHSLHNRSYIVPATSVVKLNLRQYPYPAALTADGREEIPFEDTDEVEIKQSPRKLNLIRLDDHNFYQELPGKLRGRAYPKSI